MEITDTKVREIFNYCLFKEGEDSSKHVKGFGVMVQVGFHPDRLYEKTEEIYRLSESLSDDFTVNGGGGASFLHLCHDRNGVHWGEHQNADELLCLFLATGIAKYMTEDRSKWLIFPGGLPFLWLNRFSFDVFRKDFYSVMEPQHERRTRRRLIMISNYGMEIVGTAEFGHKGYTSGLYIEKVWNLSDKKFKEYLEWSKSVKDKKSKKDGK